MEGELPPSVARLVADASGFVEGIVKANGATSDWQAKLAQADVASRRMGANAEAAAQRAATATKRAADAATALAAAQNKAADAATKLAAGETSAEEASAAATAATDAETAALEAQARASLAAQRAAITQTQAQLGLARQAKLTADAQEAGASRVAAAWDKVGKTSALIAGALLIGAAKLAGDFEQQTNVLVTAAGESAKNLSNIRNGILNIAAGTGTAWQQVTDAMYLAEKAGLRNADALNVVRAAAEGAREENAQLATVTNAITSIMADYHLKASDAVTITNEMKTAAGEAKSTFELFDQALSVVVPTASAMHISFADIAGTLAEVTQHGVSAQEAAQQLSFAMRNLGGRIGGVAQNEMAQFGIIATDVQAKIGDGPGGRGLAGTLNYLTDTILQKMGPSGMILLNTFNQSKTAAQDAQTEFNALPPAAQKLAQAYQDGTATLKDYRSGLKGLPADQAALAQQWVTTENKAVGFQSALRQGLSTNQTYTQAIQLMTGGANGLQAALQVAGTNIGATDERIKRISDSAKLAGQNVSGWESTQKLFNVQFDQFKQSAERVGIQIGNDLIPVLKTMFGWLSKHPAVLKLIAEGFLGIGAAWVAIKIGGMIGDVAKFAGVLLALPARLTAIGTASATTAGELDGLAAAQARVGAAGGVGAAEAGAAAGAGALTRGAALTGAAALRVVIPVAITYAAVQASGNGSSLSDLIHGQFIKAGEDAPQWERTLGIKIHDAFTAESPISGIAQSLENSDPFAKAAIARVMDSYGTKAAETFRESIIADGGNIAKGWHDVVSQIPGADKALFGAAGADAVNQWVGGAKRQVQSGPAADLFSMFNHPVTGTAVSRAATKPNFGPQGLAALFPDLSTQMSHQAQAADAASAAWNRLQASMSKVNQTSIDSLTTTDSFQKALNDFGSQLDTTNHSVVGVTDANIANRGALLSLITTADDAAHAYANQTGKQSDYSKALKLAIPLIENQAQANGISKKSVDDLFRSLGLLPPEKKVPVTTPGAPTAKKNVDDLKGSIDGLHGKTVDVGVNLQSITAAMASAGVHIGFAQGGLVDFYANGGTRESHVAQIAPAGAMRVWAEPETGGEAYIPLSPAKRARSVDIWQETGKRLGMYADGGIVINEHATNPAGIIQTMTGDLSNLFNAYANQVNSAVAAATSMFADPATAGPGQSYPLIINFMRKSGIPFTQADPGLNRGGHSWHEAGDAVDFSGGPLDQMAEYWYKYAPFLLEEIHSPSWYVKNGRVVGPDFYGAAIDAQHYNHVHIAATQAAMLQLLGLGGGGGSANPFGGGGASAGVARWNPLVLQVLSMLGLPGSLLGRVDAQMQLESGGDPTAVDLWDSNAQKGDPSKGLMQTISEVFATYAGPFAGRGIFDPLANIYAGINYAMHRYAGDPNIGLGYGHGYADGGILVRDQGGPIPPGLSMVYNGTGKPEQVITHEANGGLVDFLKTVDGLHKQLQFEAKWLPVAGLNLPHATAADLGGYQRDWMQANRTLDSLTSLEAGLTKMKSPEAKQVGEWAGWASSLANMAGSQYGKLAFKYPTPALASFLSNYAHIGSAANLADQQWTFQSTMFNKGLATASTVPSQEAAARATASQAAQAQAYLASQTPGLQATINSPNATNAQKTQARNTLAKLQSEVGRLNTDATKMRTLAATMRRQYAGPEYANLTPEPATRNWGYLATSVNPGVTPPLHATIVLTSQMDGQTVAKTVTKQILKTGTRNSSNGLTPVR